MLWDIWIKLCGNPNINNHPHSKISDGLVLYQPKYIRLKNWRYLFHINVDFTEYLTTLTYCRPHYHGKTYIVLKIPRLSGFNFSAKIPYKSIQSQNALIYPNGKLFHWNFSWD